MNILKLFVTIPAALIIIGIVSAFEEPMMKHIEIGTNNLKTLSTTFGEVDAYAREKHKEYNEYLSKAFR